MEDVISFLLFVRDLLPLQQGLRHPGIIADDKLTISQRPTSTTTRIKTTHRPNDIDANCHELETYFHYNKD